MTGGRLLDLETSDSVDQLSKAFALLLGCPRRNHTAETLI